MTGRGRSAATSTLLLAALVAILILGCGPAQTVVTTAVPASPAAAPPPAPAFLRLDGGRFVSGNPETLAASGDFMPWTVQTRVPYAVAANGSTYLAVNGWGVAALQYSDAGQPEFSYQEDRELFDGRTITRLLNGRYGLFVHLYFNALLNDRPRTQLPQQDFSLVAVDPIAQVLAAVAAPLQLQEAGWEPVSLVPVSRERFYVEWKHSDAQRVDFRYSRVELTSNGLRERPVDQTQFLAAYGFRLSTDAGLAPELQRLVTEVAALLEEDQAAVHLIVRSGAGAIESRIRHLTGATGSESEDSPEVPVLRVPVVRRGSIHYALLPDGKLLRLDAALPDPSRILALPHLPEGYRYTELFAGHRELVVPWEQVDFLSVAAAGVYLMPLA